jgi:hypothetical protein
MYTIHHVLVHTVAIAFFFCIAFAQAQNVLQKDATVLGFKLHYQDAGRGPVVDRCRASFE